MNPLDSLNLLEKKVEEIVYRMEILKKENFELHNLIKIEKERNVKLEQEILRLRQERHGFDNSKAEIRERIENLIKRLTGSNPQSSLGSYSENISQSISGNVSSSQHNVSNIPIGIDMLDDDTFIDEM